MSNKQISKDNREYWSNKLSKKFREKEVQLKVCTWKRSIKTLKKTTQCF